MGDYYYAEPGQRAKYLPIYPADPHPDTSKYLTLANDSELPKSSYVNIFDIRTLPYDHVEPFFRHNSTVVFRLCSTSIRRVHDLTRSRLPTLARRPPSNDIREERRLQALVDAEAGTFNWLERGMPIETNKRAIHAVLSPNITTSLSVERGTNKQLAAIPS
ncbi:hypothetical protein IMZ48_29850, partial [Candidatus Bathyarchaeota archaeon]|nr:hypothetical protein [Candidatus Bathyarchaeota archaeon]